MRVLRPVHGRRMRDRHNFIDVGLWHAQLTCGADTRTSRQTGRRHHKSSPFEVIVELPGRLQLILGPVQGSFEEHLLWHICGCICGSVLGKGC